MLAAHIHASLGDVSYADLPGRKVRWVESARTALPPTSAPRAVGTGGDGNEGGDGGQGGSGPMEDQVREEATRLGLSDLELVTDATDPDQIYQNMDALLLMSRSTLTRTTAMTV